MTGFLQKWELSSALDPRNLPDMPKTIETKTVPQKSSPLRTFIQLQRAEKQKIKSIHISPTPLPELRASSAVPSFPVRRQTHLLQPRGLNAGPEMSGNFGHSPQGCTAAAHSVTPGALNLSASLTLSSCFLTINSLA